MSGVIKSSGTGRPKKKSTYIGIHTLTDPQTRMLRWMCALIAVQWIILFSVVQVMHYLNPNSISINIPLVLIGPICLILLIYLVPFKHPVCKIIRILSFLGLGGIMSLFMSRLYNLTILQSPPDQRDAIKRKFQMIWLGTGAFFALVVFALPYLLRFASIFTILGGVLTVALLILLIVFFFMPASQRWFTVWLIISVIIFIILIVTDTVEVVSKCKQDGTWECDPVNGAVLVYLDMINVLQKLFILLTNNS